MADRRRQVQAIPREKTVAKPNLRSGVERRQKDGLGILPRATTQQDRYRRAQYNQVVIILLIILGGITTLATLEMLLVRPASLSNLWPGPILGLILVSRGMYLARRPERRREDRRHR